MPKSMHWTSHRDRIVKATIYTLNGFSPSTHIDGHGLQVFGEKNKATGRTEYFPVIAYGSFGESELSLDTPMKLEAAKLWVETKAKELGMIKETTGGYDYAYEHRHEYQHENL